MNFDKKEYNRKYMKEKREKGNIKQFKVDLTINEFEELEDLLKENNYKTKTAFLKDAIKKLLKNEK